MSDDDFHKRAAWVALRRRAGQSDEARRSIEAANAEAVNWRGRCRQCGAELHGTLEKLREHRCAAG